MVGMHAGQVIADDAVGPFTDVPTEPPDSPPGSPYFNPVFGIDEVHEHNTTLQSPQERFDKFAIMERTCSAVASACDHQRGIVGSVKLAVTEGAYADELRRSIGVVDDSVRGLPSEGAAESLGDMASALLDGIYVGAPAWERAPDGLYYPDRIERRDSRTIESAIYSEGGRLVGFIQAVRAGKDARRATLPLGQVVYCTDRSGAGPFGMGLKRVMWGDYSDIVQIQRQIRGGVRKGAFGAIQIVYDDSDLSPAAQKELAKNHKLASSGESGAWERVIASVRGIMSRVVSHVRGVFSLPPGFKAIPFGERFEPAGLLAIERSRHRRILEVVHAGHMNNGAEGTGGTYNATSEQQRVSEVIARTGVMRLIAAYNRGVVDPWYQYNFPNVPIDERAYLTFSGLDWSQLAAMVEVVEKIGDRLALGVDDTNLIRTRVGFGPMDDGLRGAVGASAQASAALSGLARTSASQLATLRQNGQTNA